MSLQPYKVIENEKKVHKQCDVCTGNLYICILCSTLTCRCYSCSCDVNKVPSIIKKYKASKEYQKAYHLKNKEKIKKSRIDKIVKAYRDKNIS